MQQLWAQICSARRGPTLLEAESPPSSPEVPPNWLRRPKTTDWTKTMHWSMHDVDGEDAPDWLVEVATVHRVDPEAALPAPRSIGLQAQTWTSVSRHRCVDDEAKWWSPETKMFRRVLDEIRSKSISDVKLVTLGLRGDHAQRLAEALQGNNSATSLNLSGNSLRDEGLSSLSRVLKSTSITDLNLGGNEIADKGLKALAPVLKETAVSRLFLDRNQITSEGLKALAAVLPDSGVTRLNLRWNSLGDEGLRALAEALKASSVMELNLSQNSFQEPGYVALLEGLRESTVISLQIDPPRRVIMDQIEEVVKTNKPRPFILQLYAERRPSDFFLTFRTLAGNVAAAFDWSPDEPILNLPEAIMTSMRSSGFGPSFKGLTAANLRIVLPAGDVLEVGSTAASLAEQLGV